MEESVGMEFSCMEERKVGCGRRSLKIGQAIVYLSVPDKNANDEKYLVGRYTPKKSFLASFTEKEKAEEQQTHSNFLTVLYLLGTL